MTLTVDIKPESQAELALREMAQFSHKIPSLPDEAFSDTNILLRMTRSDDAQYGIISAALEILRAQKARLCFTSQTLGEFWNASTRPRENRGFGLSTESRGC